MFIFFFNLELDEYRGRLTDATYYEETFGITPEKALEYKEKLHQVEEIKSSLESEVRLLYLILSSRLYKQLSNA